MIQFVRRLSWFLVLVLAQGLVLNHVHFSGYGVPVVFIYFLISLDASASRNSLLFWGFALGLCTDIFSNTPGMNAAACTLLAFVRRPLLNLQVGREAADDYEPCIRAMGFSPYFRYILCCTVVYVFAVQCMDAFSFVRIEDLLWRVAASTASTLVCIVCLDWIRRKP